MKIRLAKKIMKKALGCPKYLRYMTDCIDAHLHNKDVGKIKIKEYWEAKWALHFANLGGIHSKDDHRITKAISLTSKHK